MKYNLNSDSYNNFKWTSGVFIRISLCYMLIWLSLLLLLHIHICNWCRNIKIGNLKEKVWSFHCSYQSINIEVDEGFWMMLVQVLLRCVYVKLLYHIQLGWLRLQIWSLISIFYWLGTPMDLSSTRDEKGGNKLYKRQLERKKLLTNT